MSKFTGYLAIICVILLLLKFITKRSGPVALDNFLMRIHKFAGLAFLVLALVHLALVHPGLPQASVLKITTGTAGLVIAIVLVVICHLQKDLNQKMRWHRIMSLLLYVAVVCHVMC